MSPEQARGQAVDKRTDIWAFGCVLYEMLTGRAAFARPTISDTLAAIARARAGLDALAAAAFPPGAASASAVPREGSEDAACATSAMPGPTSAATIPQSRIRHPQSGVRVARVAALVALAAFVGAAGMWRVLPSQVRVPEPSRIVRLTNGPGREFAPAISPDRKWVAYVAASPTGRTDVWVRFVAGGDAINLTESADLDITATRASAGSPSPPRATALRSWRSGEAVRTRSPLGRFPRRCPACLANSSTTACSAPAGPQMAGGSRS